MLCLVISSYLFFVKNTEKLYIEFILIMKNIKRIYI